MKRILPLAVATLAALPLVVAAQTANTPGGQASTGTGLDQTKNAPASTPRTTQTTPDATNPSGSLPPRGTTPAANGTTTSSTGTTADTSTKASRRAARKDAASTKTGDVPTYPAPAPDGTPTK